MARCSRIGLYGDFWVRSVRWYARYTAAALEPLMIGSFTFITWCLAPAQRRAIQRNLAVLLPGSWGIANILRSLRVFWNFACSLVDAAHVQEGHILLDWEIEGMESFEALRTTPGGIIILTAHMGNYDIAAPVFAEKFGKKLHAVRLPEKQEQMQEFMESTRDQHQSSGFQIHYNRPDSMLAVELAQAIHRSEAVAIQGDRVLGEVAAVAVAFDSGHAIRVPKGPFTLSLATRAMMFPLFIVRVGWRRYRVVVRDALPAPQDPRARDAALAELASAWVATLASIARRYWHQWFVLEDAFLKQPQQQQILPPVAVASGVADAVVRMPSPKVVCPRWEIASGSVLTTISYTVGLWFLLHHVLGLGGILSGCLVWPLLMLVTLILTPVFFVIHSAVRSLGVLRTMSPQRFHLLSHYALSVGILYYCLKK